MSDRPGDEQKAEQPLPVEKKTAKSPQNRSTSRVHQPNIAAVFGVFAACVGVSIFILVFRDLRFNHLAGVIAGIMMALAVSVILFSIVSSTAPVRVAVGLGGAALFYYLLWPQIQKAINPPPSIAVIRGSIYYINMTHDLGLRPVQGAEVRVPNTTLKSAQLTTETGEFMILDAPSDTRELEVFYGGKIYAIDLSKAAESHRYEVIPSERADTQRNSELHESYIVDATLEISGAHWDRAVAPIPDQHVSVPAGSGPARTIICSGPVGEDYIGYVPDDTKPGFRGALSIASTGGSGRYNASWNGDCFLLYADGRDGAATAWARGIQMAVKKMVDDPCGKTEKLGTRLVYSGASQIPLDVNQARGACGGVDLPRPLEWKTTVKFKREDGSLVDSVTFGGLGEHTALGGMVDLWINSSGLLNLVLKQN